MNEHAAPLLEAAEEVLHGSGRLAGDVPDRVRVGVDLGTATMVLLVADSSGRPLAGRMRRATVVRDGLVVDFIGAVDILEAMKGDVEAELGISLTQAASGYPPGVAPAEVQAIAHVLGNAGLDCTELIDEPTAANRVLGISDGVVVDIGGGTTGIAIFQDGEVAYTADEATGGTHFDLVIAGGLGIEVEEARQMKETAAQQTRLMGSIRPVIEKVGAIIRRHIEGWPVNQIYLVGGTAEFNGLPAVIADYTGLPVTLAPHAQLVTPLGITLAASDQAVLPVTSTVVSWSRS